jgi:hypothetical protein
VRVEERRRFKIIKKGYWLIKCMEWICKGIMERGVIKKAACVSEMLEERDIQRVRGMTWK